MQRAYCARSSRLLPKLALTITAGLITTVAAYKAAAVDVFTDPVGFYQLQLLTNSDTYSSIPFSQIPQFRGALASAPGSGAQLAIAGSPGWAPGQWATVTANGYYPNYAFVVSGSQAGASFTITNNDASNLYVVLNPENASAMSAGDKIQIIPFWTLGTAFPASSVVASTLISQKTIILFPDMTTVGQNLAPTPSYYFLNNAWRKNGAPSASNYNDAVILPDQYVIVRQNNNATTTTNITLGAVNVNNAHTAIFANAPSGSLVKQDNALAVTRPAVQTLDQTGLSNIVLASTLITTKDLILTFDNSAQAKNKAASASYFFFNNHWRKSGAPNTVDFGPTNIFNPGDGFIFRAYTNTVTQRIWSNQPNY
jgi:uncharacterized protein (TIGR02597 family)